MVPMERQLRPAAVCARLADPEDARALLRQDSLLDQLVDRAAGAERRIELQQRLRPEPLVVEVFVDERLNPRVPDLDEAARIALVVIDEAFPQLEYVHRMSSRLAFRAGQPARYGVRADSHYKRAARY